MTPQYRFRFRRLLRLLHSVLLFLGLATQPAVASFSKSDRTIANSHDAVNRLVHEQISTPASGLGGGFDLVSKGHAYNGAGNRVSQQENTLPVAGGGVSFGSKHA